MVGARGVGRDSSLGLGGVSSSVEVGEDGADAAVIAYSDEQTARLHEYLGEEKVAAVERCPFHRP